MNGWSNFQFWGDEIFVMQEQETVYFWKIPEGEPLPTFKLDGND